ncbi:MAG: DUF4159 domain-containing protein [Bacteroidetes bacterium]|nr:DUF4159 domain-containing protein [Bacteroidota bacterium]MBV6460465.1 hypothetical protein [Flavobacteriales bacterium]WKZ74213.1 MAG: DUF4159 domain-containing protein [Vicingaceae bacterium]MCL4815879.1 DUF4159 domain-containing protein [Flavobacteriales bacterium]NOG94773.1 DUF4159 domain-containing protein [Bacteroidota bacterium]
MKVYFFSMVFFVFSFAQSQNSTYQIALLKYSGGGDWYANLETSLPNLIKFCNQHLNTNINKEQAIVEVGSEDLFNYPFVHLTGHGNIILNVLETENLRKYLVSGGFLHISDNYGLDKFMRREMKKVFPELDFIELPFSHPIYNQKYKFQKGLPKIHEHDNKPPQGFGIIYEGRLVVFYDYECDLGDGWESKEVHNNSEETRLKALQMGANIIQYVFSGNE